MDTLDASVMHDVSITTTSTTIHHAHFIAVVTAATKSVCLSFLGR